MARGKTNIPAVLQPEGTRCVPLYIPDDPDYITMLVEHIRLLGTLWQYDQSRLEDARVVATEWLTRTWSPLLDAITGEIPCGESTGEGCTWYGAYTSAVQYTPHNPFSSESRFDPQYPIAPFFRFAAIDTVLPNWIDDFFTGQIEYATGYRVNDVFVSYLSLPTINNPFDGLDYPTIRIRVEGSGTVRLHLLAVPFGGRVLLTIDDKPDLSDLVNSVFSPDDRILELNRDILAIPPETDLDEIEEVIFEDGGVHDIYLSYIWVINDEAPFLQMGGGFRGFEVCDGITVLNPETDEPIDITNPEQLFQRGVILTTNDDLFDALLRYENQRAMRWLLASNPDNVESGVDVTPSSGVNSDDGITIKPTTVEGIKPTLTVSAKDAHNGGVYRQAQGFANMVAEANSFKSAGWSLQSIINITTLAVNPTNLTSWEALVTSYFNSTEIVTINVPALAEFLYCGNRSTAIVQYCTDNGRHNEAETDYIVQFASEVPAETWSQWYAEGKLTPRSNWLTYGCTLLEPKTIEYTSVNWEANTAIVEQLVPAWLFTQTRLVRIELSGLIESDNGKKHDGIYYYNGSTWTYSPAGFYLDPTSGANTHMLDDATPRSESGYSYSFDVQANLNYAELKFARSSAYVNAALGGVVTGSLVATMTDLGSV